MKRLLLVLGMAVALCLPAPAAALADSAAKPRCQTPVLTGFTAPGHAYAGDALTATVTLSCAPRTDFSVAMTSDAPKLTVPATVTVRAGRSTAVVPLNPTGASSGRYTANLTVSAGTQQFSQSIVVDPGLKLFELVPSGAPNAVNPEILVTGPAPAGGITVHLASDNPAVEVPATVTVPEGSTGILPFGMVVHPVTKNTTVHITASLGTRTLTGEQTLLPPFDDHSTMTINPEFEGDVYGLDWSREFVVHVSNPAPDPGLTVNLKVRGDNPAITLESPSTFISSGSLDGYFDISAADVTTTTYAVIDATIGDVTSSITVRIQPRVSAITIPATVQGGNNFQGTVTLAGPSNVDTQVRLQQSWGIVDIPISVTIPAGQTSATFTGTTVAVDSDSDVSITAYLGDVSVDAQITLTP